MRSVQTPLSRRTLLTGAVGTGVVGACLAAGGDSASALSPAALQVTGSTRAFSLGAQRSASLLSSAQAEAGPGLAVVSVPVDGGHMVGVTFPSGASTDTISVRVRLAGGGWTGWSDLPLNDSEPDPDTAEGRRSVTASDPMWVGALGTGATVQVRLPQADVADAHLQVVDAGEASALARTTLSSPSSSDRDAQLLATKASPKVLPQPTIKTRAQWGADESLRKGGVGYSDTIKACVVHHTADGGTYSQSDVPSVIRSMYRYHTVSLGWSDLGYNFVVDRFGGIWEGRAGGITLPVVGAHAGGFNTDTFGVSMMGDFTSIAPSAACLESVAQVIAWKLSMYGLPADGVAYLTSAGGGTAKYSPGTTVKLRTINAHRDVGYTACPGNVGFTKMDAIRDRVDQLLGGATITAIAAKYAAIGGAGNLGGPTTDENDTPNGAGPTGSTPAARSTGPRPPAPTPSAARSCSCGASSAGRTAWGSPRPTTPRPRAGSTTTSRAGRSTGRRPPAPTRSAAPSGRSGRPWAGRAAPPVSPSRATARPRAGSSPTSRAVRSTTPPPPGRTGRPARSATAGPRSAGSTAGFPDRRRHPHPERQGVLQPLPEGVGVLVARDRCARDHRRLPRHLGLPGLGELLPGVPDQGRGLDRRRDPHGVRGRNPHVDAVHGQDHREEEVT